MRRAERSLNHDVWPDASALGFALACRVPSDQTGHPV